jgi:hypothetical protein
MMDERDHDAQHSAIEHFMHELRADRTACTPQAHGLLLVAFHRGAGVLCELRFNADGRVVPR